MSKDLKTMTRKELRTYMLEHRNDEQKLRAAIEESSSRPGWTEVSADVSPEEMGRILERAISKQKPEQ